LSQKIDVKSILQGASPSLASLVPNFLLRILARIIHQKEINKILYLHGEKKGLDFIRGVLDYFHISLKVYGQENLQGLIKPIVASNHPLGGMDGMILLQAVGQWYPGVKALVNDLLLNLFSLKDMFIPVNKHGSNRSNLSRYHEAYEMEEALVHFPAGLCSRKKAGVVRDLPWEKSFIRMAKTYNRPIVPTFFSGVNREFFYNLANLRRWSGLGFNIEMLFLVDEMFKQQGKEFAIHFGTPVYPQDLDEGSSAYWAKKLRRQVYEMQHEIQKEAAYASA
jgi:putative hemolysin